MIQRLFTEIAGCYDRLNHVFSLGRDRGWRRRAVAAVKGRPARILDLATGTGDLAFALNGRFPDARILGVDLTPAMLAVARAKNASPNIVFAEGDATRLAPELVPDAAFDLATCAFGFRNIPDKAAALREARRALRPGGEFVVLEFFRPTSRLLWTFTRLWLKLMTAVLVPRHSAAYAYLAASMKATVSVDEFRALARQAGFCDEAHGFHFPCCTQLHFRRADS